MGNFDCQQTQEILKRRYITIILLHRGCGNLILFHCPSHWSVMLPLLYVVNCLAVYCHLDQQLVFWFFRRSLSESQGQRWSGVVYGLQERSNRSLPRELRRARWPVKDKSRFNFWTHHVLHLLSSDHLLSFQCLPDSVHMPCFSFAWLVLAFVVFQMSQWQLKWLVYAF